MALWQILGWIIAALLGLPAAIYYSLRLKSRWDENKEKQHNAVVQAKESLMDIISEAKNYKFEGWRLTNLVNDFSTPKKLRAKLSELARLAEESGRWRYEAGQIINKEAELASREFEDLDKLFVRIFHSNLASVFRGVERTPSEGIYIAIYNGNLSFELARDSVLKDRWESKVKFKDEASGEEKELRFRDVVEGKEFHNFIERLQKLQDRESIKMLREVQARFVYRAEGVMREV